MATLKDLLSSIISKLNTKANVDNGAVVSGGSDYAICFEWSDGNSSGENRMNRFVQLSDGGNKISIATANSDICGVTTDTAAFVENYGIHNENTALVGILGVVTIIDKGTCTVGETCISDDEGYAVPSNNNMGYRVMERLDENHIRIAVKPNDDMVQRIKSDMSNKADANDVNELKDDIDNNTGRDEFVITEGAFVNANNGNIQSNTSGNPFAITGINVIGGSKIKLTLGSVPYASGRGCAFYRADGSHFKNGTGNILYTVDVLEYEIEVPDDATMFGFTVFGNPTDYIIKINSINGINKYINGINNSIGGINDSVENINNYAVTSNFNLSNMEKIDGYFVNGIYGTLTEHSSYDCYRISDLIAGVKIKITPNFTHSAVGYVFKDSDSNIKGTGIFNGTAEDEYTLVVPNGANSLTFTHSKTYDLPVIKMLYTSEEIYKALRKKADKIDDTNLPLAKLNYAPTFITMFRRIIHIGDSLTRGQYNTTSPDNSGADLQEYSRPAFMQRMCGNVNVNLGIGGATVSQDTSWNWIDVAKANTVFQWSEFENAGDCYIIALGTNDISKFGGFTGDISTDIDTSDYRNNATTSVGCYAKIIQMIREIQSKAVIFCVTIPRTRNDESTRMVANTAIKSIAGMFGCYVIDLETYAEQSSNGEFAQYYKNASHNNALGYNLRARQYIAYIDWIIENNLDDFRNVQFIGTEYDYVVN